MPEEITLEAFIELLEEMRGKGVTVEIGGDGPCVEHDGQWYQTYEICHP